MPGKQKLKNIFINFQTENRTAAVGVACNAAGRFSNEKLFDKAQLFIFSKLFFGGRSAFSSKLFTI